MVERLHVSSTMLHGLAVFQSGMPSDMPSDMQSDMHPDMQSDMQSGIVLGASNTPFSVAIAAQQGSKACLGMRGKV